MKLELNIESYEAYNIGHLLGKWHDVSDLSLEEFEELLESISKDQAKTLNKLLKWNESLCEELFVADYECDLDIEYNEDNLIDMFNEFQELKALLENYDQDQIKVISAIRENEGREYCDTERAIEIFDCTMELDSSSNSEYELGYATMSNSGELDQYPDHIKNYFDYESFGRDLILGGDYNIISVDNISYAVPNNV